MYLSESVYVLISSCMYILLEGACWFFERLTYSSKLFIDLSEAACEFENVHVDLYWAACIFVRNHM